MEFWNGKTDAAKRLNELWEELVPSSGMADTTAGEAIRAAGRINHDMFNNGGGNIFDKDYDEYYSAVIGEKWVDRPIWRYFFSYLEMYLETPPLLKRLEAEVKELINSQDFDKELWVIDEVCHAVLEKVEASLKLHLESSK